MDAIFENLCEVLGDELERQENVLAQCRAQQEALKLRDLAGLEARSAALQILFRASTAAEPRRQQAVRSSARHLGLQGSSVSLTGIVLAAPSPWNTRLEHLQSRLRETVHQSRAVARDNATLIRKSLRAVGRCLRVFQVAEPAGTGHYTPAGQEATARTSSAVLLNQRG